MQSILINYSDFVDELELDLFMLPQQLHIEMEKNDIMIMNLN
jgi:hypothetical protein